MSFPTGEAHPRWNGGVSVHPLRGAYQTMLTRCYNENSPKYPRYGGRGIQVCEAWRTDFWQFVADVGERPPGKSAGGAHLYTLDRIDNDGNYESSNVRWATASEQALNRTKKPRETCPHGHSLAEHGVWKVDYIACRLCLAANRARYNERQKEKKA